MTYIYKIYYISRNARVYIPVHIEYSYLHIYTPNAGVLRTRVDIKNRFCKIGYGTLLRQMCRVLLFLLSSLKLG